MEPKKQILLEDKIEDNLIIDDIKTESSFMKKFQKTFLNIEKKHKKKRRKRYDYDDNDINFIREEFFNKNLNEDEKSETSSVYSESEDSEIKLSALEKFRFAIKKVIQKKNTKEWNEFMKLYEKNIKENISWKSILKNVFNINSDFMIIWKVTFSTFCIIFVFIFFLKYILLNLSKKADEEEEESSLRILLLYHMINLMFLFEFVLSVLTIAFNGGSIMTYLKLPLKAYNIIPFTLKKKNIFLLIPKFFRIDIFEKICSLIEMYINTNIALYVNNYYVKIFIAYTNDMFKCLLVFGFYAHCLSCLFSYFEESESGNYVSYIASLYYNIQTFTTIGFGELSPSNIMSLLVMILTLFLGVNFMAVITSNIRYLAKKIREFNRETSFSQQFEFLIFKIQKSTGKVFPSHLKQLMSLFLLFRRGLAYSEIKKNNKRIFDAFRNKIVKTIHKNLFDYLKEDFNKYFHNCEDEFIYEIFECMKPKMFKANKTIIDYNTNVKGLYFIINGYIFIYNKNNKPVYSIIDNNLLGEYEFICNTKSNYSVKVHPRMAAYGFVLKKSDWDKISKKYIKSAKNFFDTIYDRKKKHNEWILKSLIKDKNENIINDININTNMTNEDNKDKENLISDNIIDTTNNENPSFKKPKYIKKKSDKNLLILAKTKDEKYDINNKEIFKKIDGIRNNLEIFEHNLIQFKKGILNILKMKKL